MVHGVVMGAQMKLPSKLDVQLTGLETKLGKVQSDLAHKSILE